LEAVFDETRGKVVVDSSFCVANNNCIIKFGQTFPLDNLQVVVTSIRQSSEWGIRQFQSWFPRVKDEFAWKLKGSNASFSC
jgi:hypothetical protein